MQTIKGPVPRSERCDFMLSRQLFITFREQNSS